MQYRKGDIATVIADARARTERCVRDTQERIEYASAILLASATRLLRTTIVVDNRAVHRIVARTAPSTEPGRAARARADILIAESIAHLSDSYRTIRVARERLKQARARGSSSGRPPRSSER